MAKMWKMGALALMTCSFLSANAAQAAVPATSLVEGTLNSNGGGPAADGLYALTFAIYKDELALVPLWTEGPANVNLKGGQFSYVLGSTVPLKGSLLNSGAWLTMKVGGDPELPRKAMNSVVYALRASVAEGLDCSGCIAVGALDPAILAGLVKGPLADVAKTGAYADLIGAPVVGKLCPANTVLTGFNANGSLDCVPAGAAGSPDSISLVSNGLIFNTFNDQYVSPKGALDIVDNDPVGISDTIVVTDNGLAQKLTVSLTLTNSDISGISVYLYDPTNVKYTLFDKNGKKGDGIITTYPDNTKPLVGDLTAWIGKNPKGNWKLQVIDLAAGPGGTDGKVTWSVNVQTLSTKKIQVKGDLIVEGNVIVNGINPLVSPTYRWAVWSTFDQSPGWFGQANPGANGDGDALLFGGVKPQAWSDGNGIAANMSPDKAVLRTLFNKTAKIYPNTNVWAEAWYSYSSTNGKLAGALFRIKNSTNADIVWSPMFDYTSYSGWSEIASVQINGINSWQSNNDCYTNCTKTIALTVPKNRMSTAIFVSASSPAPGSMRSLLLAFINNTLTLPPGLTFVDDLDYATGGWEQ